VGSREVGFCRVEGLVSEHATDEETSEPVDRWRAVTLRRALALDRTLFEWRERAAAGRRYPRDVALDQLDAAGERCVNTFVLRAAWPTRWSGPVFDALADGIAFEELELAHEGLVWMKKPGSRPEPTKSRPRGKDGRSA
jgi:phage tail-like protein